MPGYKYDNGDEIHLELCSVKFSRNSAMSPSALRNSPFSSGVGHIMWYHSSAAKQYGKSTFILISALRRHPL